MVKLNRNAYKFVKRKEPKALVWILKKETASEVRHSNSNYNYVSTAIKNKLETSTNRESTGLENVNERYTYFLVA